MDSREEGKKENEPAWVLDKTNDHDNPELGRTSECRTTSLAGAPLTIVLSGPPRDMETRISSQPPLLLEEKN